MKAFFQINTVGRAYAWLLGFGLARTLLDYIWVPTHTQLLYKILSLFNTTVYQFTLYLVIPAIAGYILERIFSKQLDHGAVLRESVLVWAVYPSVTIISLILKSPPTRTIEWFRYIPTFMVDYNFLPAGMIAVIPILFIFYTWLLMRHSDAGWPQALASVYVSLLVVYLVYYQYTAQLFLYVLWVYGPFLAFGYYTLTYLIPLFPLAGRFHSTFGNHSIMLPKLVLVCSLLCFGLMAVGLLSGTKTQALPSSSTTQTTMHWNLRLFQFYDQTTGKMKAYGYYLDSNGADRMVRQFRLFHASWMFQNIDYVTSDTEHLAYRDLLDVRIEESKLIFDWNRASAGDDPFLETFQGTDVITKCTARLDGENYRCFLLDENISADVSKLGSWEGETFLSLAGEDISLVAFAYDDYTDGIIALGNDHQRVTKVSRHGSVISISFENGSIDANCSLLAQYETLGGLDPQPVDSPVHCELVVKTNMTSNITTSADGVLEWIGQTQGE